MMTALLIVVNAGLAFGLVLVPALPLPLFHTAGERRKFTRLTVGMICVLLAALNLLVALGPGRNIPLLSGVEVVSAAAFYVSAGCYVVGGWALLRSAWHG
jgi:hypothetical protein